MEERTRTEPVATSQSHAGPRLYRSPRLTAYGSVTKLTQGAGGSIADGASGMNRPDMPDTPGML